MVPVWSRRSCPSRSPVLAGDSGTDSIPTRQMPEEYLRHILTHIPRHARAIAHEIRIPRRQIDRHTARVVDQPTPPRQHREHLVALFRALERASRTAPDTIARHMTRPARIDPSRGLWITPRNPIRTRRIVEGPLVERPHIVAGSIGKGHSQPPTAFTSMKSSRPHLPPSRPLPEAFIPPKGDPEARALPFISTIPVRNRRATRRALSISVVWT